MPTTGSRTAEAESFKRSCAAEIGRRLFQSEALRFAKGSVVKVPIPHLGEKTVSLMREEGWDLALLQ